MSCGASPPWEDRCHGRRSEADPGPSNRFRSEHDRGGHGEAGPTEGGSPSCPSRAVNDIDDIVARLRSHGAELVGEIAQYEDIYRLCFLRGPEGIIIGLAEQLS